MRNVTIDYEGHRFTRDARDEDTHVVAWRKPDDDISVRATDDPVHVLVQAQDDGDPAARVARIDHDEVAFTVVPDYDPFDTPASRAARRNLVIRSLVAAVILAIVVIAVFFPPW